MVNQATFAGGCFWCTEAIFLRVPGVTKVVSGYAGGQTSNPDYRSVCSGTTGHAECCQIDFDPTITSYETLLRTFFATHDPTTLNRQGNDSGTQYRSVIFHQDESQKNQATSMIEELQPLYRQPIVTEVQELKIFYPAEDYHQNYFALHPDEGYCRYIIAPKVLKLEKSFTEQ